MSVADADRLGPELLRGKGIETRTKKGRAQRPGKSSLIEPRPEREEGRCQARGGAPRPRPEKPGRTGRRVGVRSGD
jgi:hypothetical protein